MRDIQTVCILHEIQCLQRLSHATDHMLLIACEDNNMITYLLSALYLLYWIFHNFA